ncbi:MAG: histidine phosphatase family protein, partial [Proteobacteria bacterium]|nr:histidine phosphatase family protein [Pseudomonadota bacterium]
MHRLLLMRHARAAWSQDEADQERSLGERGRLEAQQM